MDDAVIQMRNNIDRHDCDARVSGASENAKKLWTFLTKVPAW